MDYNKVKQIAPAIICADDLMSMPLGTKETILSPWLTEQSITLISGWRGVGKTWFALSMCDCITKGLKFGPWDTKPFPSFYIDGELPDLDIQERLLMLSKGENRKVPLWIYSDAYANGLGIPRANILSRHWREQIKSFVDEMKIKLVCFDNIGALAPGIDENSKQAYDPINQWLLDLRFAGVSTILLHHTGKGGLQRGTSAREDNIDNSLVLQYPPDYVSEQGAKFILKFKKSRVRIKDLKELADIEFTLLETDGKAEWTWGSSKRKIQLEILNLLDEGVSQSDIAKTLDVNRSHVCKTRQRAIKNELLTEKGKLTQKGQLEVNPPSKNIGYLDD